MAPAVSIPEQICRLAAALLAGLGIVFSILAVMLVVYAFVTKDPNSIYGYFYQIEA